MPELRERIKTMLSERNMELAQDEEVLAEYVKLMRELNYGPEFIALVQSGKHFTDDQLEAVIKTLGL